MSAIALVLGSHVARRREAREGREDVRQLRSHVLVQAGKETSIEPAQVLVQSVHEHGERQVALELRRGAREGEMPAGVRPRAQLREQPGLANPGLADDLERGGAVPVEPVEHQLEQPQLIGAPHEVIG